MLVTTETVSPSEAGCLPRSNSGPKPTIGKSWFMSTAGAKLRHRHSSTQHTRVRWNHRFIANRPRGHAANCAPYLTPPVRANIAAFVAKRPLLLAWPPPHPWEHSSQWSCPSPRGNSHSDVDHAWVHRPDNGSPLVRRCDRFPTAFQRQRFRPDVRSRPAACVVELCLQPTWSWSLRACR